MVHDYSRRGGVERTEIMLPADAPAWVHDISREALWNAVEASEKRKDAQVARELWITIPRELGPEDRIQVMRDFVTKAFVSKGMIADVAWHCPKASDGLENPHAHVMLTMRPLTEGGFGKKSRHDWVPDPEGRTHPDGKPVMVESNPDSWNTLGYFEKCREDWENAANAALARAGSDQRIDRRSLLERGLARIPEPALRLAFYLKELHGVMRERFGQFQMAKHYQAVERRAKAAFRTMDAEPVPIGTAARAGSVGHAARRDETPARTTERYWSWFERQLTRLSPSTMEHSPDLAPATQERAPPRSPPNQDMER